MWTPNDPFDTRRICTVCGATLTGDLEDDPSHPSGPICGECHRAREDDEIMWAMEARDQDEDLW